MENEAKQNVDGKISARARRSEIRTAGSVTVNRISQSTWKVQVPWNSLKEESVKLKIGQLTMLAVGYSLRWKTHPRLCGFLTNLRRQRSYRRWTIQSRMHCQSRFNVTPEKTMRPGLGHLEISLCCWDKHSSWPELHYYSISSLRILLGDRLLQACPERRLLQG
jgi:hypothetical protein